MNRPRHPSGLPGLWLDYQFSHIPNSVRNQLFTEPQILDNQLLKYFVRAKGLEPIRIAAPDPKSGLSTNSNTPAIGAVKVRKKGEKTKGLLQAADSLGGQGNLILERGLGLVIDQIQGSLVTLKVERAQFTALADRFAPDQKIIARCV